MNHTKSYLESIKSSVVIEEWRMKLDYMDKKVSMLDHIREELVGILEDVAEETDALLFDIELAQNTIDELVFDISNNAARGDDDCAGDPETNQSGADSLPF